MTNNNLTVQTPLSVSLCIRLTCACCCLFYDLVQVSHTTWYVIRTLTGREVIKPLLVQLQYKKQHATCNMHVACCIVVVIGVLRQLFLLVANRLNADEVPDVRTDRQSAVN